MKFANFTKIFAIKSFHQKFAVCSPIVRARCALAHRARTFCDHTRFIVHLKSSHVRSEHGKSRVKNAEFRSKQNTCVLLRIQKFWAHEAQVFFLLKSFWFGLGPGPPTCYLESNSHIVEGGTPASMDLDCLFSPLPLPKKFETFSPPDFVGPADANLGFLCT